MDQTGADVDADLLTLLKEELSDAEEYTDSLIGPERATALDYYLSRPMGDERTGRSRVISSEVYKVVEGLSTAIANIYATAKDAVEFVPRGPEDVKKAEQRTATVNYVFNEQNNGFLLLVESIKDGVLSKTGFLTWRWDVQKRVTQERYRDQTPESLQMLLQDTEDVQIIEQVPKMGTDAMGQPVELFDVVARVVKADGRVLVETVPPEEVLVSSRAKSADIAKAPCIHWRCYKTRAELQQMGFDEDMLQSIGFGADGNTESPVVRRITDAGPDHEEEALVITTWLEHDYDEDGIAELRRIVWCGDVILENEITDHVNISAWSPNLQPHEFFGRCPADDAIEAQQVMTAIKRQTLDNLYFANNPMWRVDASDKRVNLEDFYDIEIGRPVRAPPGAADVIAIPFVAQHSFPMLEYEQADTENKTGFTRYAQGLDAKSLNQTARGISIITNMSQQRVQLMARIYGEMCLKPCMRGIAKLLSQHGEKALAFRLNGEFVTVDPREWAEEFDMTVTVGLGVSDKDQQLLHLTTMAQAQGQVVAGGGLGTLVTPQNIYNVQAKIAENAGFRDASFAWTNPATAPAQRPKPQAPDPEMVKLQADAQKTQAQIQADGQKTVAQIQADAEKTRLTLESQERVALAKAQIDAEAKIRVAELSLIPVEPSEFEKAKAAQEDAMQTEQVLQSIGVLSEAMGQAMQMMAQSQQMLVAALERMNAPKRLVRDEQGRPVGVETVKAVDG